MGLPLRVEEKRERKEEKFRPIGPVRRLLSQSSGGKMWSPVSRYSEVGEKRRGDARE